MSLVTFRNAPSLFVICLLVLAGCQEKRTYTVNPDGSGKLVFECSKDQMTARDRFYWPHDILFQNIKAVDAWSDATVEQKDGKAVFRGTVLFPDINKVNVGSSGLNSKWTVKDGVAVLELDKLSPPPPAGKPASKPAPLTEAQIAEGIKAFRDKPVVPSFIDEPTFRKLHLEYIFHLPGSVVEQTNFSVGQDGSLSMTVTGDAILKATAAIKASDSDVRELVLAGEASGSGGPLLDAKMRRALFGKEAGLSAKVKLDKQPKFDYASELAAANKNYLSMMTKLGLSWADIPKDLPLRFKSLAPYHREKDCIWYKAELPRAAAESRGGLIFRMTAEDGTLLLPRPGKSQELGRYNMGLEGFVIPIPADLPAGAKTIKEVLGAAFYTAADEKKVDLGFDGIAANAKGKAYEAKIASISTKTRAGKERTVVLVAFKLPKDTQLRSADLTWPDDKQTHVSRDMESWGYPLADGFTAREFSFVGPLTGKPTISITIWEHVEEFVVPFRLTGIPLTEEGFKAAQAAASPAK